MLTDTKLADLNAAIGEYKTSDSNPCGVSFYFDEGEEKPWRIADDGASDSFGSFGELLAAAKEWKEAFDFDSDRQADWNELTSEEVVFPEGNE